MRPEQGPAAKKGSEPVHASRDSGMALAYPTGDRATSTLLVEVTAPTRMAVGRPYDYQIRVTNLTKGLVLEDVGVHQTSGESLAVESSDPKLAKSERGEARWTIPRLGPGETATIKVTALGEKEGQASSCIRVTYEPTLCVATEFIKPEVQVTKEAPKAVDICDPITFRYVVKNTGSGAVRGLRLSDELPRGLTTADGKQIVATEVGDLAEGQAKEVTVKLAANQVGDFTSRAVTEGQDELRAQSNQTTTAVRQPKLTVKIAGPESEYVDERVTYQVTVKNEGEAPAAGPAPGPGRPQRQGAPRQQDVLGGHRPQDRRQHPDLGSGRPGARPVGRREPDHGGAGDAHDGRAEARRDRLARLPAGATSPARPRRRS